MYELEMMAQAASKRFSQPKLISDKARAKHWLVFDQETLAGVFCFSRVDEHLVEVSLHGGADAENSYIAAEATVFFGDSYPEPEPISIPLLEDAVDAGCPYKD